MPNYVKNEMTIRGNKDTVIEIMETLRNDDYCLDFNKIAPMPKEMDLIENDIPRLAVEAFCLFELKFSIKEITDFKEKYGFYTFFDKPGSSRVDYANKIAGQIAKQLEYWKDGFPVTTSTGKDPYPFYPKTLKTLDDYIAFGKLLYAHLMNFGALSWYRWNINNWGTKWGACDANCQGPFHFDDHAEIEYCFETAWSTPIKFFEKLSQKYPEVNIKIDFADEDIGRNCGTLSFLAGIYKKTTPDHPRNFANALWGHDLDEDDEAENEDNIS